MRGAAAMARHPDSFQPPLGGQPPQQRLEGQYTTVVYGLIRQQRYQEAVSILCRERHKFPRSRAALSLLGYCYFHMQDYSSAAATYEALLEVCPEVEEYRVYLAQALYKGGCYHEAMRAAACVESPRYARRMLLLQSAIKYQLEELLACRSLLDQAAEEDPETLVNYAAIDVKEGRYEAARERYLEALTMLGYQADLAYNIALCHFKLKQFGPALKFIMEIIERGVQEHPELSVGSNADGVEVRSVGNSPVLQETYLIEAFNLKAAIEFTLRNHEAAREALSDMPPRLEEELDPVTLHNQALVQVAEAPAAGFRKLRYLLTHPRCPPETLGNLLLLQCRHQRYDAAAEVLRAHSPLAYRLLSPELRQYLEATVLVERCPEEAYRRYDALTDRHIDQLRKLTKAIQDARLARDNEAIKRALKDYDEGLEGYIPVLMAMARIYWRRENYAVVESLFRQSAEFCSEHDVWKLNVAHVFFMQETKWKEAIRYYDPIVQKQSGGGAEPQLLNVPAAVLANLCVAYIMTSQNEAAEELMRKIEKEEERLAYHQQQHPHHHHHHLYRPAPFYHLCLVNVVIGTLYCAKGNFEFGVTRVIKSLEPYERKLSTDTWYYAKRCLLALAEAVAKRMLTLRDALMHEVLDFLDAAELHGAKIRAVPPRDGPPAAFPSGAAPIPIPIPPRLRAADGDADGDGDGGGGAGATNDEQGPTVGWEARQLKALFVNLMER